MLQAIHVRGFAPFVFCALPRPALIGFHRARCAATSNVRTVPVRFQQRRQQILHLIRLVHKVVPAPR